MRRAGEYGLCYDADAHYAPADEEHAPPVEGEEGLELWQGAQHYNPMPMKAETSRPAR